MPRRTNHVLRAYKQLQGFPKKLFALSNLSKNDRYETPINGGEAGVATGFGAVLIMRPRSLIATSHRAYAGRAGSTAGWNLWCNSSSQPITCSMYGSSAWSQPSATDIVASDLGKIHCFIGQHESTLVRAVLDNIIRAGSLAISGFTASATSHMIGDYSTVNPGAEQTDILAHMTWRGILNTTQLQALLDTIRNTGDVPSSIAGVTVTHRWSLRATLTGQVVADGQTAPASLADTITAAAADLMSRVGSPVVRTIDPWIEGRKAFAAMGFSTVLRYETALGIRGNTAGTWIAVVVELMSATGTECFLSAITASAGWDLLKYNGTLMAGARTSGGTYVNASGYTFTLSDTCVRMLVGLQYDPAAGGVIRTILRGVQVGSDVALGVISVATAPMQVGVEQDSQYPATQGAKVYGWCGGDGSVPTPAEWLAQQKEFERTGRIRPIPGKTTHLVDLTKDMNENGGPENGAPLTLRDRVGSSHFTRYGGWSVDHNGLRSTEKIGIDAVSLILRTIGSSFSGSTSPWSVEVVFYHNAGVAGENLETIIGQSTFTAGSGGWYIYTYPNTLRAALSTTGGTITIEGNPTINAGVHTAELTYDGGQFRLFFDGVQVAISAAGIVFQPAASEALALGAHRPSAPVYGARAKSMLGATVYNGLWSAAEIATAAAAAIAAGKPVGVPSKNTKQWRIPDDIAEAGGKVPTHIKERIAGSDHMQVVGQPLQVSDVTDRLYAYETDAIMHRTADFDVTTKSISGSGGTTGAHAAGLWFAILLVVLSQTTPGPQHMGGKRDLTFDNGWGMVISANNGQIWPRACTTYSASLSGPIISIGTRDVGRIMLVGGVLDPIAGVLRSFARRAEVSSGTSLGGNYLPAASAPCTIGPRVNSIGGTSTQTLTGVRIFGMMCGQGVPVLSRWQQAADAAQANEDIVAIPGMTEHLWSITQSVRENGGTMPSTIVDRIGTDHMTVAGLLASENQTARFWGW